MNSWVTKWLDDQDVIISITCWNIWTPGFCTVSKKKKIIGEKSAFENNKECLISGKNDDFGQYSHSFDEK